MDRLECTMQRSKGLQKGGVELSDGTRVEADVIISYTEYQVSTVSQLNNEVEILVNERCRLIILFYPMRFVSQFSIINRVITAPTG